MDQDYIFTQLDKWEADLVEAYSKMKQESVACPISQKIINKLIVFSKVSEYCQIISDAHTRISLH